MRICPDSSRELPIASVLDLVSIVKYLQLEVLHNTVIIHHIGQVTCDGKCIFKCVYALFQALFEASTL